LGGNNEGTALVVENAGPVSVTLKAVSTNPLRHTTRVTLFANNPRIEIEDSIQANFKDTKTWAFSFNVNNPTTRHEELGAVLTVKKESRGGHYADENARYDWQTFNHFANMSESNYGITLSNMDCSFFKLGSSTIDSLRENAPQINALAGGNIDKKVEDGGVLGIFDQNGNKDFLYHFALTTHQSGFNAVDAMKFSLEHQNPLVACMITGAAGTLTAPKFSLLSVDKPNVLLWSVKPSEEGIQNGTITRFWNVGNQPVKASVLFNKNIKAAWQTSHIETNIKKLTPNSMSLQLPFRGQQMNTYRWLFK
jgi:alpha-mannosidase